MRLNGEPLDEVDCFRYLGSQVAADEECERDVTLTEKVCKAWGVLKRVLTNRGLGINAKKFLYEGVIVLTACTDNRHGFEKFPEKESDCS